MNSYRLTLRAEDAVIGIFLYGIDQFGLRQARVYRDSMEACFQLLADNPRMGRPAPTLGEGVRRHEHDSHVILYEVDEHGILILAVVHARSVRQLKL